MIRTVTAVLMGVILSLGLSACGGGGADVKSDTRVEATTKGQQLLDLKRALDSGVITQSEYEEQRKKVLDAQ